MSKIIDEYVNNNNYKKSSDLILKIRLWYDSLIYLFSLSIGLILIQKDFTTSKDPYVRLYQHNRWLLITTWFNLIALVYKPICIYCDWRELSGTSDAKHVRILNKFRFICFSSILFPSTCFSDILFWKLWTKDRELVAPLAVEELVPVWLQHCLHTVTMVNITVDLLLVPRQRPKNLTFGAILLSSFLAAYAVASGHSIVKNEHIYPLLRMFSGYRFIPLAVYVIVEHFFYFTVQWLVIELVWGQKTRTHALMAWLFSRGRRELEPRKPAVIRQSRKDTFKQNYTKVKAA